MPDKRTIRRRGVLAAVGAAATATALAVTMGSTAHAATLYSDNFDDGDSGDWSKSGGTWAVVTDGSPVLQQSNATSQLARQFAGQTGWTNYTVQARVKPLSYGSAGLAALAARSSSATKMYRLALLGNGRAELQAVNGSTITPLGSAAGFGAAGTWHTLRIEVSGSTIRGFVNGTPVGSATNSLVAAGRIGLVTAYASASFDDVTVDSGGSTPPTTPPPTTPPPTTPPPTTPPPTTPPPTTPPPTGDQLVVAPNGDDAAPGTLAQPLRTIQRAVDLVRPGGTIALRAGTYAPTTNIQVLKNGTAAAPITITRYGTERVLIDGEQLPHTPAPLNGSIPNAERGVFHIEASYWRFVGLEIANGPYGIFCRDCSNNVFDRLVTRDNYETGLHIQGASSNNQVLNLDAYGNRDPRKNGESADGLAIKEGSGAGNVVRGARLWNNVDDGFDAWEFLSPILVEDSVAWGNGVNRWGFPNFAGDGNGFKMGGGDPDDPAVAHTVRNSIAFDNAQGGFVDNGNPGTMTYSRNTAWDNGGTGFNVSRSRSTLTGNLSVSNQTAVSMGTSTGSGNSWNIGGTWNDASLVSTNPAVLTGPRTSAGAIPTSNFLHPVSGAAVGARI
ncbi:right-handed parallel beta-helix repeat-containing protein [Polymorphospora rubra]|uniref:right-handed parallel beta-helix repeat-containing protein n=1 Tax=Polymorphospora rubra TaxID=338584 RepID=UPI0033E783B7